MIQSTQEPLLGQYNGQQTDYVSLITAIKIIIKPIRYIIIDDYLQMCVGSTEEHLDRKIKEKLGVYVYCFEVIHEENIWKYIFILSVNIQKIKRFIKAPFENENQEIYTNRNFDETRNPELILKFMNEYLQNILQEEEGTIDKQPLLDFFGLNVLQRNKYIQTLKECPVIKIQQEQLNQMIPSIFNCCQPPTIQHILLINKQQCILYKYINGRIDFFGNNEPLQYDQTIKIKFEKKQTSIPKAIIIELANQKMVFRAKSHFEMYDIMRALMIALPLNSNFKLNRFLSYAPSRNSVNNCVWYVDGEDYFDSLHKELYKAKDQVFISSSIICPEFVLKRPLTHLTVQDDRFDYIIKRLAEKGIKIFILVNQEENKYSMNQSNYIKKQFQTQQQANNKNIFILKHPVKGQLWFHNEKYIVIDQHIGYIGGMDIAYGRWDNNKHKIQEENPFQTNWPGIDYVNFHIKDQLRIREFNKSSIDSATHPRMPWHDIGVKVQGGAAKDLAAHFIQCWYHAYNILRITLLLNQNKAQILEHAKPYIQKQQQQQQNIQSQQQDEYNGNMNNENGDHININNNNNNNNNNNGINGMNIYDSPQHDFSLNYFSINNSYNIQLEQLKKDRDSNNMLKNVLLKATMSARQKSNSETHKQFEKYLQQRLTIRTESNKNSFQEDKQLNFINFHAAFDKIVEESGGLDQDQVTNIQNTFEGISLFLSGRSHYQETIMDNFVEEIDEQIEQLETPCYRPDFQDCINSDKQQNYQVKGVNSQILRSTCDWSVGLDTNQKENSIYLGYVECIENSKHYIYVESQLFLSDTAGPPIKNKIAVALLLRIKKAYYLDEKFRVIIIKPLLQPYSGSLQENPIKCLYFTYEQYTIFRGNTSIFESLSKEGIDPHQYIQFFGLRTHGVLNGVPTTEIIHVAGSVMIIDDVLTIIGSANISDKSLDGAFHSELAVVVEDQSLVKSKMNGDEYYASKFAISLRKSLFKEHFCLPDNLNEDPLSDVLWEYILNQTQRNTEIYSRIFKCIPDDSIKTFEQMKNLKDGKWNTDLYYKLKDQIVGQAVQIPQKFLEFENLKLALIEKGNVFQEIKAHKYENNQNS